MNEDKAKRKIPTTTATEKGIHTFENQVMELCFEYKMCNSDKHLVRIW